MLRINCQSEHSPDNTDSIANLASARRLPLPPPWDYKGGEWRRHVHILRTITMTEDKSTDSNRPLKTALPSMRERARDYIHLMFLVDDFQRASTLNKLVVEGAANMFAAPLSEEVRSNLEHKVSSEILLILEMARNLTIRGEALIKQAELVMSRIPSWDEP
jgi:hypothetical protein